MQYAHWRGPNTQSSGKGAPTALLSLLGEKATVNGVSISWPLQFEKFVQGIDACVVIMQPDGDELNQYDTRSMISQALDLSILDSGGGKPISPQKFLHRINVACAQFFGSTTRPRNFVTGLSINAMPRSATVLGNAVDATSRSVFPFPEILKVEESFLKPHVLDTKYQAIVIKTDCISVSQAMELGQTIRGVLLGLINHFWSFRDNTSFSIVAQRDCVGRVIGSPVSTLHDSAGVHTGEYSYDAGYFGELPLFSFDEAKLNAVEKYAQLVEASPMRKDLIDILCRYASAVSESNHGTSFLLLWSLLEKITNNIGANYDQLIERACWGYDDLDIAVGTMRMLRIKRNAYVHSAATTDNQIRFCYMLKQFVDRHLRLLLVNHFRIHSLREYSQILDCDQDQSRFQRQLLRDRVAYNFLFPEDSDYTI